MRIDPKVEESTRRMLGHVIRGEFDDLTKSIRSIGDDQRFRECLGLCTMIAGYVAVDVNGCEWPGEASIRKIAEVVGRSQIDVELDQDEVHDFLAKSALGFRSLSDSFPSPEAMATQPIYIAAALLLAFFREGGDVWGYLDEIEEALEASASIKPSIAPAVVLRSHMLRAEGKG